MAEQLLPANERRAAQLPSERVSPLRDAFKQDADGAEVLTAAAAEAAKVHAEEDRAEDDRANPRGAAPIRRTDSVESYSCDKCPT